MLPDPIAPASSQSDSSKADALCQLAEEENGRFLSDEEFEEEKMKILNS